MITRFEQRLADGVVGKIIKRIHRWPLYRQLLLLLLVMAVGWAVRDPATLLRLPATCSRAWRVLFSPNELPLTKEQRRNLQAAVRRVTTSYVKPGLDAYTRNRTPSANLYESWPVAQMALALYKQTADNGSSLFPPTDYSPLVDEIVDPTGGWKEYHASTAHPVHVAGSGWTLFVKGRLEVPATDSQINFLVTATNSSGGWPMFPSDGNDSNYGSTYATAWAGLALHEQAQRAPIQPEQARRCRNAVMSAYTWLHRHSDRLNGLWKFYYDYPQQNEISWSNSGLVIHFFHHLERDRKAAYPISIKYFDRAWLSKVSTVPPLADSFETWNLDVPIKGGKRFRENVRCLKLPWVIIATVDSYANGTFLQKMKAVEFMDNLGLRLPTIESECSQEPWMLAELLVAMRHLESGYLLNPR